MSPNWLQIVDKLSTNCHLSLCVAKASIVAFQFRMSFLPSTFCPRRDSSNSRLIFQSFYFSKLIPVDGVDGRIDNLTMTQKNLMIE